MCPPFIGVRTWFWDGGCQNLKATLHTFLMWYLCQLGTRGWNPILPELKCWQHSPRYHRGRHTLIASLVDKLVERISMPGPAVGMTGLTSVTEDVDLMISCWCRLRRFSPTLNTPGRKKKRNFFFLYYFKHSFLWYMIGRYKIRDFIFVLSSAFVFTWFLYLA